MSSKFSIKKTLLILLSILLALNILSTIMSARFAAIDEQIAQVRAELKSGGDSSLASELAQLKAEIAQLKNDLAAVENAAAKLQKSTQALALDEREAITSQIALLNDRAARLDALIKK